MSLFKKVYFNCNVGVTSVMYYFSTIPILSPTQQKNAYAMASQQRDILGESKF